MVNGRIRITPAFRHESLAIIAAALDLAYIEPVRREHLVERMASGDAYLGGI